MESLNELLQNWNKKHDSRAKLQHTYLVVAVALVVLAGLIGLVNMNMGQQLLAIALVSAAVFLINAVAWALLESSVINRVGTTRRTKSTKTAPKTTAKTRK